MIGNDFLDIMMHERFTGHQSYVLLCTETTFSKHHAHHTSQTKLRRPSIKKSLTYTTKIGSMKFGIRP